MDTATINAPAANTYVAAATIDEVIAQLEAVIDYCKKNNSRAGYFAMLYYCVTCRVKKGILNNEFENGPRMERLDVFFAGRYLQAWHEWRTGGKPTQSWATAFKAVTDVPGIVLQHLLLGINAHINLDLGIATVETMAGQQLDGIEKDFNAINTLLASMIGATKACLSKINPLMYLLKLQKGNLDDLLVQFSIDEARKGAWAFAVLLSEKTGTAYAECIAARDSKIAELANNLAYPDSGLLRFTVKIIRLFESSNIEKNICSLDMK
jgi:hypothetical protein